MRARHLLLESPAMGRAVHVWCYGHFGPPVVVFPSAAGFAHEWDRQGMLKVLAPLLAGGKAKFYCPESNVSEVWTRKDAPLAQRMARHLAYERFIMDTLVPFIRDDCHWSTAPMIGVGCSVGGTYAALFALKQPETFRRVLCMSGRYLTTALTGADSQDVYFNNPLAFVPGLQGEALDHVRRNTHLTLVCGRGAYEDGCIEETIALGNLLQAKQIPSHTDIWGRDSRHDWDWWHRQAAMHLPRLLG